MSEIKAIEKLRSIWKQLPAPTHSDELLLADMDACIKAIEAEIADNYLELPKDADGIPIRVGDTVSDCTEGGTYTVKNVNLSNWGWRVIAYGVDGNQTEYTLSTAAERVRHVKPRTLENIVAAAIQYGHNGITGDRIEGKVAKFCAEIRELLGGDAS